MAMAVVQGFVRQLLKQDGLTCFQFTAGQFQIPYPPSNLEPGSSMAHEFEVVANNLRDLTTRIALRDKIHSIKVCDPPHSQYFACQIQSLLHWLIESAN